MDNDIAIKVERLSKKYRIQSVKPGDTLRDKLAELGKPKPKTEDFWALKDVSFEVKQGEVLGIIGKNGSGKSTLLKILSRITEPTEGKVTMRGRVASLLEVGTGFNPELSGRENIFLNGAILGMGRREISKKFNEIVDFSGVIKFIDTPVKRYSSGMYVRLAFAVAAHLNSDILLVDEVLAVGDAEFQTKCLGKMKRYSSSGKTVLFVSHNTKAISELCSRCLYLNEGNVKASGETGLIIQEYLHKNSFGRSIKDKEFYGPLENKIIFTNIQLNNSDKLSISLAENKEIRVKIEGISKIELPEFYFLVSIFKNSQIIATAHSPKNFRPLNRGGFSHMYTMDLKALLPGDYTLRIGGHTNTKQEWIFADQVALISVKSTNINKKDKIDIGVISLPYSTDYQ